MNTHILIHICRLFGMNLRILKLRLKRRLKSFKPHTITLYYLFKIPLFLITALRKHNYNDTSATLLKIMSCLQLQTLMLVTPQQKVFCAQYWAKVSSKKAT